MADLKFGNPLSANKVQLVLAAGHSHYNDLVGWDPDDKYLERHAIVCNSLAHLLERLGHFASVIYATTWWSDRHYTQDEIIKFPNMGSGNLDAALHLSLLYHDKFLDDTNSAMRALFSTQRSKSSPSWLAAKKELKNAHDLLSTLINKIKHNGVFFEHIDVFARFDHGTSVMKGFFLWENKKGQNRPYIFNERKRQGETFSYIMVAWQIALTTIFVSSAIGQYFRCFSGREVMDDGRSEWQLQGLLQNLLASPIYAFSDKTYLSDLQITLVHEPTDKDKLNPHFGSLLKHWGGSKGIGQQGSFSGMPWGGRNYNAIFPDEQFTLYFPASHDGSKDHGS